MMHASNMYGIKIQGTLEGENVVLNIESKNIKISSAILI